VPTGPRVPKRFDWSRFDAPELATRVRLDTAVQAAKRAVADRKSVILCGKTKTGKTSLLVAMLRLAAAQPGRGRIGRFVPARDLGAARAQHGLGRGEAPLVEMAQRVPLLALDELGLDQAWELSAIPDVIAARHDALLTTWVTTGLTVDEIEKRYGSGVSRRLFDPTDVSVIPC
jgi:DNA replication protein DnaC